MRIGGVAFLLAALTGCYQARVGVIEDGVPLPFGEIATCKIGEKAFRFDLTHPEPTAGGGTIYRLGNETLAFKRLSETLYLAQINSSGLYRYGYVLRNGSGVEVLALRQEVWTDPAARSIADSILFKPVQNGWQEMVGTRADLTTFLSGAKPGMMHPVGQCTFSKAALQDTPWVKGLKLSTTREQVLKLPGAEACGSNDVCLPLSPATIERIPAAERGNVRIRVAFDQERIRSLTLTATDLSPASTPVVLDDVGLGSSRSGPFVAPLVMALNDGRLDVLKAKVEAAGDPQRVAELMRPIERLKNLPAALADPDFRSAEMLILPVETFATLQGFASADAAMAEVQKRQGPYVRTILKRSATGQIDALLVIRP